MARKLRGDRYTQSVAVILIATTVLQLRRAVRWRLVPRRDLNSRLMYIAGLHTHTKSPSFCLTVFSASLTHLTSLLRQSRDCGCYVSRPILAPPPLWMQEHTDLRAHDFAHSSNLWHQPRLAKFTCAWSWRLYGIKQAVHRNVETYQHFAIYTVTSDVFKQCLKIFFLSLHRTFWYSHSSFTKQMHIY